MKLKCSDAETTSVPTPKKSTTATAPIEITTEDDNIINDQPNIVKDEFCTFYEEMDDYPIPSYTPSITTPSVLKTNEKELNGLLFFL